MPTWAIILLVVAGAGAIFFWMKRRRGAMAVHKPMQAISKSKPKSRWRRALGGVTNVAKVAASMTPGGAQALGIGGQLGLV